MAITFTIGPTWDDPTAEDGFVTTRLFHLAGPFTVHWRIIGQGVCQAPNGILLPKGVPDSNEEARIYWSAPGCDRADSINEDTSGSPLNVAPGYYYMELFSGFNSLTVTITQP